MVSVDMALIQTERCTKIELSAWVVVEKEVVPRMT
jgi:hypothetical protein